MRKLKIVYGIDPSRSGFYAPYWPQKKKELLDVRRGDPVTFHSTYQGDPSSLIGGIFQVEDIKYYTPPDRLHLGIQDPGVKNFVEKGLYVIQSWDTAFSEKRDADYTVGLTGVLFSCNSYHREENKEEFLGPCEPHYDLYIVDCFRELLAFPKLTQAVRSQHLKWQPQFVLVEDRASGISLIQVLQTSGINIEGVKSIEGKRARATTSVGTGSVQGWMNLHRVLFPYGQDWLDPFIKELLGFTGDGNGYDDQVDALVTSVIHTIKLSSGGTVRLGNSNFIPPTQENKREEFANDGILILGQNTVIDTHIYNPFEQTCKYCRHRLQNGFCEEQNRTVSNIDSCYMFSNGKSGSPLWI